MIQSCQLGCSPQTLAQCLAVNLVSLALEGRFEIRLTWHGGGTCSKSSVSIEETVLHNSTSSSKAPFLDCAETMVEKVG
jgi:hypothetical protein